MEFDHAGVLITPDGPQAAQLAEHGLHPTYRRDHPGQGTSNMCFCFDNAFLELMWRTGPAEGQAMRLALDRRGEGGCPLLVAVRLGADEQVPFPHWDYRPAYMPQGTALHVSEGSEDPSRPLVVAVRGGKRPDAWTTARQHGAGVAEIGRVDVGVPTGQVPGDLDSLSESGVIELVRADAYRLDLELTPSGDGPARRLQLPAFAWREV